MLMTLMNCHDCLMEYWLVGIKDVEFCIAMMLVRFRCILHLLVRFQ